jgi:ABC-type polysaccharide/polyol phosphate export permease
MTVITPPPNDIDVDRITTPGSSEPHPPRGLLHDVWVVARRGVIHMKRQPEALSDATIQPIMFVLLFAFVFGGAIRVPGAPGTGSSQAYREFLMGGIFAQTLVFSAFGVAMGIANDRKNQVVDRFRSLPIANGAVLGGHAVANLIKALLPIVLMSLTGLVVGWRIHTSFAEAAHGYVLMLAFAFAMIWIGVLLGSLVPTPEGVTGIAFAVLFPITFIASTFVPLSLLPEPLRTIAAWNPTSTLSDALRELFGNPGSVARPSDPWPTHHPVLYTWIWIVGIVLVMAPIAVRAYRRSITD